MEHTVQAIIITGSNLGDKYANLEQAASMINAGPGKILLKSEIYQTAPWEMDDAPVFLNQALLISTALSASELMMEMHKIEANLGRIRYETMASRTIDIDLMFYGNQIIHEGGLTVPHPRLHLRRFNLLPINEIAPDWLHPVLNQTIHQLLKACTDSLPVSIYFPSKQSI